jgi:hypothetical protein
MLKMLRTSTLLLLLASPGLSAQTPVTPPPAATSQTPPAPVKATPQNATAFIGECMRADACDRTGAADRQKLFAPCGDRFAATL